MSIISTILGSGVIGKVAGKVMDTISPDKAESRRQQIELNKLELEKLPAPSCFCGVLRSCGCLQGLQLGRLWFVPYW